MWWTIAASLAGFLIGMATKAWISNDYLMLKADADTPIHLRGKFYYLVSEKRYNSLSINKKVGEF